MYTFHATIVYTSPSACTCRLSNQITTNKEAMKKIYDSLEALQKEVAVTRSERRDIPHIISKCWRFQWGILVSYTVHTSHPTPCLCVGQMSGSKFCSFARNAHDLMWLSTTWWYAPGPGLSLPLAFSHSTCSRGV